MRKVFVFSTIVVLVLLTACSGGPMSSPFEDPSPEKLSGATPSSGPAGDVEATRVSGIEAALHRHEAELMSVEGVQGVGIGQDAIGNQAITVYVRDASVKARIPKVVDGFPTKVEVSGEFFAQ